MKIFRMFKENYCINTHFVDIALLMLLLLLETLLSGLNPTLDNVRERSEEECNGDRK